MIGMRTRQTRQPPGDIVDVEAVAAMEKDVADWRAELLEIGSERTALHEEIKATGETSTLQRALASLDMRKQRLIWNIRETEQDLRRASRRRPDATNSGHR